MIARLMGLKTISPAELSRLLREGLAVAIDVNSRPSWARAHVPGARSLDPADFQGRDLPTDFRTPLVFYCSNPLCRKAPLAARRAEKMGYGDVRVMPAGISGWVAAGLPVESGE